ncbi:MAG: hypothetical protein M1838_003955 [Thelocarpon superellum]|nr:MAG: hypothetical protein M1838_003955 [Thelocarpon superellum]
MLTEHIVQRTSVWSLPVLGFVLLALWAVTTRILKDRRIRVLGSNAPNIPQWPGGLDFIYNALSALKNNQNVEFWSRYLHGGIHTVEIRPLLNRVIMTSDPENIKAILASQFQDYGKGEPFRQEWHDFLGDSIFTTDLEQWHQSRQLLRPMFIKDRVSDLMLFEKHVDKMLHIVGNEGHEIDLASLLARFTLDASTDYLLGHSVESLDNPQVKFSIAFTEAQRLQSILSRAGPLKLFVPRGPLLEQVKTIDEFLNPYIDFTLSLPPGELEKHKSDEGYTFLHALATFTRDRKVIRDQLIAVLLAGRDSTSAILSWTFFLLSRHPAVLKKLRHEILTRLGPNRQPTYDDLKAMKYLQHTLSETMRIFPVLPFNVRLALHDTTLPRGGGPDGDQPLGILKDTPIAYSTILMQRRADLYPPPSATFAPHDQFSPERWDHWTPKPWQYIPFNGGPRICIGQQFALAEMGYTITRILQRFERIEGSWPQDKDMPMMSNITLQPAVPLMVRMWPEGAAVGKGQGGKEKV